MKKTHNAILLEGHTGLPNADAIREVFPKITEDVVHIIGPTGSGKTQVLCMKGYDSLLKNEVVLHNTVETSEERIRDRYNKLGNYNIDKLLQCQFKTIKDLQEHIKNLEESEVKIDLLLIDDASLMFDEEPISSFDAHEKLEEKIDKMNTIVWLALQANGYVIHDSGKMDETE